MMRKLTILAAVIGMFILLPLLGLSGRGDQGEQVEITEASYQVVRSSAIASGVLAFREEVLIRSEIMGTVDAVLVEEGETVLEGDVIIRIDADAFQAQYEQQEAVAEIEALNIEQQRLVITNLESRVERNRKLHARGAVDSETLETMINELKIAELELQTREAALARARAELAQVEEQLNRTVIRAPLSGIVTDVSIKPGETVIAGSTNIVGTTLMTIADPSEIIAELQVDETEIADVNIGMDVNVHAVAFADEVFKGKVHFISSMARRGTESRALTFLVKARIEGTAGLFVRPGMSCRAEIFTNESDPKIALPVEAVMYDDAGGEAYVYVFVEGSAKRRDVLPGISSDEFQAIDEGVEIGESIVTGPYRVLRRLQDGDKVRLKNAAG